MSTAAGCFKGFLKYIFFKTPDEFLLEDHIVVWQAGVTTATATVPTATVPTAVPTAAGTAGTTAAGTAVPTAAGTAGTTAAGTAGTTALLEQLVHPPAQGGPSSAATPRKAVTWRRK